LGYSISISISTILINQSVCAILHDMICSCKRHGIQDCSYTVVCVLPRAFSGDVRVMEGEIANSSLLEVSASAECSGKEYMHVELRTAVGSTGTWGVI
jgi:hypothetical protein